MTTSLPIVAEGSEISLPYSALATNSRNSDGSSDIPKTHAEPVVESVADSMAFSNLVGHELTDLQARIICHYHSNTYRSCEQS